MSYPETCYISLKETETVYLFGLPRCTCEQGTEEGDVAEKANEFYHYITVGKGKYRKVITQQTQTPTIITHTRSANAERPKKKDAASFAAPWDMHDTYAQLAKTEEKTVEDDMVLYPTAATSLLRKKRVKDKYKHNNDNLEEIAKKPQFLDAVTVILRFLTAKDYEQVQRKFRGMVPADPLSKDLVYSYSMKELWKLESQETAGRPITSISFNSKNSDILAVAHGRFAYTDNFDGIICIWNTKNPFKPERLYRFEQPLSSIGFSKLHPNLLACGFFNGDVCILDITSYSVKLTGRSKRETNPCFEPIWVTQYCTSEDGEYVMTACQDGRINRFVTTTTNSLRCTSMMRITAVEGEVKGLVTITPSVKVDVPINRYPAALCVNWHPTVSHEYLVGADDGCIYKCSTHHLKQHIDVIRAHAGPVYGMEFSPFMNTLLVTCGADNSIRLWLAGIDDAIMTLSCPASVYGVAFSPINATILISLSGNILSVWDLRRKTHTPCAEIKFEAKVVLTYVKCWDDNVVFVGDTMGLVHTFHLEDTPIPPYDQRKMLDDALKKALCNRPHLLRQMEKLDERRLQKCKPVR